MIERAVMVEAVEQAMQAFGVGRLDLAFEALRGLLTVATATKGSASTSLVEGVKVVAASTRSLKSHPNPPSRAHARRRVHLGKHSK